MKLTKEMRNWTKRWLDNLVLLIKFSKTIPTVPYSYKNGLYGNGLCFGVQEARSLLDKAESTETWKVEIMKAIAHRKTILMEAVIDDQKVIGKAWIVGLKAVLNYVECVELYGSKIGWRNNHDERRNTRCRPR